MRELLLVRYGEIFLKGLNRPFFMRALVKKIRHAVQELGAQVWLHDGRIFVSDFADQAECIRRITKVLACTACVLLWKCPRMTLMPSASRL